MRGTNLTGKYLVERQREIFERENPINPKNKGVILESCELREARLLEKLYVPSRDPWKGYQLINNRMEGLPESVMTQIENNEHQIVNVLVCVGNQEKTGRRGSPFLQQQI